MHLPAAVLPALVAVVLLVAGVAKIRHRADTRDALGRFGIPAAVVPAVAVLLPWAEILVAVILLFAGRPVLILGAAGALVLTGGFFFVVVRAVVKGDDFECGCFGAWNRTRVTPLLAVRNGALLAAAIAVAALIATGFPGMPALLVEATGADVLWVLMLLAGMGLTALFMASSHTRTTELAAADSFARGEDGTDAEVVTAAGEVTRLRDLAHHSPQVIMFIRPGCGSCEELLLDLEDEGSGAAGVWIAVSGHRRIFEAAHPALASRALYAVQAARNALGVHKTPTAVVVGLNGVVDAGPVSGATAVRDLLARSAQKS